MKRSTVLDLPLQQGFRGYTELKSFTWDYNFYLYSQNIIDNKKFITLTREY